MAFCEDVCCNAEARARKEAAERAEFERRQAEFECFLRDRGIIDPEPPKVEAKAELTPDELLALESWFLRHPAAVNG
jgi:hypothetical protein